MHQRLLAPILRAALADRPVVLLQGPRQAGKTTLARTLASERGMQYHNFDDISILAAARADPSGFIRGLTAPAVLDEVQRIPEIFPVIKMEVDLRRTPGRFLLTGSADVLALPKLSESLAGRMELLTLWPMSQAEIEGSPGRFLIDLFNDPALPRKPPSQATSLVERITRGGFPEVVTGGVGRPAPWFGSYLTTILQRDVRDLASIEDLTALPRLLGLIAGRPAGLLNYSGLSRDASVPLSTLKRYFALLENTFLVRTIPAWFANIGQRLVKSPKVVLTDTGLAAHLLRQDSEQLGRDPRTLGGFLEAMAGMELRKMAGWSEMRAELYHFRSQRGDEVDLVIEGPGGDLVGIEVKAAAAVSSADFKGLRALAAGAGKRFLRGVVLYTGTHVLPFGPGLEARPIQSLWT